MKHEPQHEASRPGAKYYRKAKDLATRFPIETNVVFFLLGLLVTAAVFRSTLSTLASVTIPAWIAAIAVLVPVLLFAFIPQFRRGASAVIRWRFLGACILVAAMAISGVFLATRPNPNTLAILDAALAFPIASPDLKAEFIAHRAILQTYVDLERSAKAFPEYFQQSALTRIDSVVNDQRKSVNSLFDSLAATPQLRITLLLVNRIGLPTSVYKVTGELQFARESDFLGGGVMHIDGRNIVTDRVISGCPSYPVEFVLEGGKKTLPPGAVQETLDLTWTPPDSLGRETWVRSALLFELRGREFMDYFNDDYKKWLRRIFETYTETQLGEPERMHMSWKLFGLVALKANLQVHHTHGVVHFEKIFAIGTADSVAASDILGARP